MDNRFGQAIDQKTSEESSPAAGDAEKAAKGEDNVSYTRLNVRVPTPLYEAFKEKAEGEGRTMTWIVLNAIKDYIGE